MVSSPLSCFFKLIKEKNIDRVVSHQNHWLPRFSKELTRRNPTVCYELMDNEVAYSYIENLWDSRTSWSQKMNKQTKLFPKAKQKKSQHQFEINGDKIKKPQCW